MTSVHYLGSGCVESMSQKSLCVGAVCGCASRACLGLRDGLIVGAGYPERLASLLLAHSSR
jgi:hypothetical protein